MKDSMNAKWMVEQQSPERAQGQLQIHDIAKLGVLGGAYNLVTYTCCPKVPVVEPAVDEGACGIEDGPGAVGSSPMRPFCRKLGSLSRIANMALPVDIKDGIQAFTYS